MKSRITKSVLFALIAALFCGACSEEFWHPEVIPVNDVNLNKSSTALNVGKSETLVATIDPRNAKNKKLTWRTSNTLIASITQSGVVKGEGEGKATITVTTDDGNKTASCEVTVSAVHANGVTLDKTAINLSEGGTETLTASVSPADATDKSVKWSSSSPAVTVSSEGVVTGISAGSAVVTATSVDGGYTATCEVTVLRITPANFASYLASLPANTVDTPYNIRVRVSNAQEYDNPGDFAPIYAALKGEPNKYVNLDLTGSTVRVIPHRAFITVISEAPLWEYEECATLTEIIIPNSVTKIGVDAFNTCTNLKKVTIPNTVTIIEAYSFPRTGLTSLTIPDSVTSIGKSAFDECRDLISVSLGNGITSIGDDAFNWCEKLASVTFLGTIPSSGFSAVNPFMGDLRTKFYAQDPSNGTPGTYTTTNPGENAVWRRQ